MKQVNFLSIDQVGEAWKPRLMPATRRRLQSDGVSFFEIATDEEWVDQSIEANLSQPTPVKDSQAVLDGLLENTIGKFQEGAQKKGTAPTLAKNVNNGSFEIVSNDKSPVVMRAQESHQNPKPDLIAKQEKVVETRTQQTVMLVQDDKITSGFLLHLLSRRGFRVELAGDCAKAVEMLDEILAPKLVILDIMLPFSDGFELIKRIRSRRGWEEVIIMMMTSKTREQDIVQALDDGTNDYVVKPIHSKQMLARMESL